ncbi:Uncharacterised protein [Prevotella intermedia]|nr:Uncharacterised protein [Prevotella intermedia]
MIKQLTIARKQWHYLKINNLKRRKVPVIPLLKPRSFNNKRS